MAEKKQSKFKSSLRIKLLMGLATVFVIALMFPKGESIESDVSVGSIWMHDDLIAPFSFPILKDPDIYNAEVKAAEATVYPVFQNQNSEESKAFDSLKSYNSYLLKMLDSAISVSTNKNYNPSFLSSQSFNTFKQVRHQEIFEHSRYHINFKNIFASLQNVLTNIYRTGILNLDSSEISKDSIAIRIGNIDRIENLGNLLTYNDAISEAKSIIESMNFPPDLKKAMSEYIRHFIFPDIIYNADFTNEEITQAKNTVSKYSGIVNENERIIAKHDRITKEDKLKIESFKAAKGEEISSEEYLMQFVGKILHIAFLLALLTIYLFLFRKRIFYDNSKLLIIIINILFISAITYIVNQIYLNVPVQYLIFVPVASMLITIIFDSRVGFYSTVILVLIVGALRGNDYSFASMSLFASALSAYTVRDIKNRSQIFRSFLFILIGYVVSILAFDLERFAPIDTIFLEMAFAGTNALVSPVLTYGLLIFFERIFNITTDLTLLELSNFDRPLLKELARRAPGTFNHSMTMGTLAEAAAESIGANSLLARVGSYYHDIGKTISPQNFVENQLNNQNVHENLTPEESISLIIQHVKEGVKLAEENNLPQEIIDFIPMHHGTTTISYFYDKAKKLYGEEKVDINDYKYPGPKPNTKETTIVMLADGCESAVRSIVDPDSTKVENVIEKIIQDRIEEGQLDNSPLTFSDLNKIKDAFIGILLGQHHKRIRYPKQDEIEKGAENKQEDK
jgi:putative nucleotidyltransferase with HDIG domain